MSGSQWQKWNDVRAKMDLIPLIARRHIDDQHILRAAPAAPAIEKEKKRIIIYIYSYEIASRFRCFGSWLVVLGLRQYEKKKKTTTPKKGNSLVLPFC